VDVNSLSRLQFALTISFHFIFPAVTIGLSTLIAIVETLRWWTKRDVYDRMSVFITKLFAVTFVIGVVSGIVMEFQFGTNWAIFSGYVGDIFGAPLAAEGIFAFFLESAFIGVVLFGRNRVGSTVRWIAGLLVALGTTLSAFWILVANSWMQTPAGYKIVVVNGAPKAELTDFWAAVFNPSTLPRFLHTMTACIVVGAFFLMGLAAWYYLRGRASDVVAYSMRLSIVIAFLGAGGMFATGDLQTREVAAEQPLKFAAMEGVCQTADGVALDIVNLPPGQNCESNDHFGISIPFGLSAMSDLNPNGQIKGLDQEADQSLWPPVAMTFLSFHAMVGLGSLMMFLMLFGAWYLFRLWRSKKPIEAHKTWLKFAVVAIPLPILATEIGWMTAEIGRQPWLVQGLLKTAQGGSPGVTATDVLISIFGIVALYAFLFLIWLYAMYREIGHGPELAPAAGGPGVSPASTSASSGTPPSQLGVPAGPAAGRADATAIKPPPGSSPGAAPATTPAPTPRPGKNDGGQ
jgi:cytochrome bd ubiquinol oxidase subunit I